MGNLRMNADQISYKGGEKPMSVEEAIKNAGNTGLAHTADIAPDFSAESAYNAGDLVYHNGTLYVFTANHAAGAWSTEDTQAVTVGGELTSLMSGLTNVVTAEISAEEGVTIIRQKLRKSVNTVTLICMLQKVMTLDTANLLCILPSGYRPPDTIEFVAINSTKELPIIAEVSSTSGGVYVRPTSASADAAAQNICIFLTYVV